MGNLLVIETKVPKKPDRPVRIKLCDDYEDTGWLDLLEVPKDASPEALLEAAWEQSDQARSLIEAIAENSTNTWFNEASFEMAPFLSAMLLRRSAAARAQALEGQLPPAPELPRAPRL